MNPEPPSRAQIEARITALLLGELPTAEAELLRWTIAQDAGLQKLHDELQSTIVLVREAVKPAASASAEKSAPLKLSDERRRILLNYFKTPRPQPSIWLRPIIQVPRLVTALALVAVVGLLAAMLLPSLAAAKKKSQRVTTLSASKMSEMASELKKPGLQFRSWGADNSDRTPLAAIAPPASASTDVTLAPEPVLAPPPVQIVLPQLESAPEVAAQTGAPVDSRSGGVHSQRIDGYVNAPLAAPAPAALPPGGMVPPAGEMESGQLALGKSETMHHNADTQERLEQVEKQWTVPAQALDSADVRRNENGGNQQNNGAVVGVVNAFAGTGGFRNSGAAGGGAGGGGFGGFGGRATPLPPAGRSEAKNASNLGIGSAPASPAPGSVAMAWNDSSANRAAAKIPTAPVALNAPANAGEEFRDGVAERDVTLSAGLPGVSAAQPQERSKELAELADKVNGANPSQGGFAFIGKPVEAMPAPQPAAVSTVTANDSLSLNEPAAMPAPTRRGNRSPVVTPSTDAAKTPLLGDVAVAGNLFQSAETDGSVAPPPAATPSPAALTGNNTFNPSVREIKAVEAGGTFQFATTNAVALTGGPHNTFSPATVAIVPNESLASVIDQQRSGNEVLGRLAELRAKENDQKLDAGKKDVASGDSETVDFNEALVRYGELTGRTLLRSSLPSPAKISLPKSASKEQEAQAIQLELAKHDISLVNVGNKFLKVLPANQAGAAGGAVEQSDLPANKQPMPPPVPQPEILTRENNFSTFSLNVSDVSFKLAAASLEKGRLPDAASIRSEEFINAFDYRDPEAKWDSASGLSASTGVSPVSQPLAFAAERARYPFAHNRDLLRFSVKTAAAGRPAGRALNLVLLLDTSGSMERADRVAIIREALRVLAAQLQPQDTVSVVTFARTARLWADGVPGDKAGETLSQVGGITPDGGTNLEEAMRLAYETARRHYLANGMNRVVLLTDGAANLGNVDPGALKQKVDAQRRQGIALDCFGIGWEDFNDDLLEQLSGNGDGRYAFINSPEDAGTEFAVKLAGALQVAAQDVKVQVEFNPQRVISWRQIGYAKHQLTKEQFRDNSVIAAEIAAQEAGNALYTVETRPDGLGPIATVYVRYRVPNTQEVNERSWAVDYDGTAPALENSSPAMRLAATAAAFSEWLAASPFAQEVTPDELLKTLSGVPEVYGADSRPMKLAAMIREAKSIAGK